MKQFIQAFLLLACLLAVATGQAQTPVASYAFSGNAYDANGNHAAIYGALPTADRFGRPNNAFLFDGVQAFLEAPNSATLNSDYATVMFWVNPTELPAQGEGYLVSFGGWQERYKISLPSHGKCIWTTNASSGISDMDAGAGNELQPGVWKHLAFVHDGAKDRIYVNGVQVAEKNVTGTLNATTRPLGIGYDAVDKANYFKGALDEVMIFGSALSAAEIASLYAAQNTPPAVPPGVVAAYLFSGNTLDESDFSNHATAQGARLTTDRFGFGHSAYRFDPAAQAGVVAPNSSNLNSAYTTISFWVNPNSLPPGGEVYLLSNGGWQERWKISLPGHGKPVFTTHANGACCSDMDSGSPLTVGTWTHVVMVHDGAKDIIYFNGVKVNEKAVAGALDPTTKPLGIGFDPIDQNYFFDGSLDDVVILNFALTEAEVAGFYAAQAAFPGAPTDLVAEYKMNGNGDDDTQFHNNSTYNGKPVANRFGWANNATQFDGTAGNTADNSVALQSDYTTISFWVNPKSFPPGGEVYLLSHGGWQERWKISLPGHGKPVFTTHANGACCSDMDSGTPLTLDAWTHVAMVHDGAKDIIYFNGVKVNEKTVTGALDKTKFPLGIGYNPIDGGGYFDGNLDDIRLYNRALSEAEIAALYGDQSQAPAAPGNLIADYPFSGNALDHTVYSNHATAKAPLTTDRFGRKNQAYAFDGKSASVEAPNSAQQNSDFTTISFWVNPSSFPPGGEAYLLSNGGWQERWKISLPGHGKPVFTTHANGACCSDMDAGTPLTIGAWTHVAMVHDGTKDIIYFNGAKVNEKTVAGALDPTTKPLGIGFDPIDQNYFFDGALDEVQLYNKALTDAEIAALYGAQSQPPANTDTEAPSAPLNLSAQVIFTDIALRWFPSTDNVGVVAYNVYQDGKLVATVPTAEALMTGLTPLTNFVFGVSALDAAGNESLISSLKVKSGEDQTPDVTPPSAPGNLKGTASANSVLLSWDASTDDREVTGYVILIDGAVFDTVSATTFSILINGLTAQTLYTFEVYAFDKAGNNSNTTELTLSTTKPLDTGEPGLVAHYPFDGNANDATPYANHGAIGGNPVFETPSHPNGGGQNIKFDGDRDSVLVPNAVQLISDYTTVGFWIRVDALSPLGQEDYVLDFGHWDQRWKISLPGHSKIVWTTNSNTAQFPHIISDMDTGDGNELGTGTWWYVTMVHDGTNDIIYLNGAEAKRKPSPGKLNSTARPLCFGGNPIEGGQYFAGALDNVKIYNKALTDAEIAHLYSTGTSGADELVNLLHGVVLGIAPNPATSVLTIKHAFPANQPLLVRVFDLQGRQVDALRFDKNAIPDGQFDLHVGTYPQGQYTLNFVLGGKNLGGLSFNKQ